MLMPKAGTDREFAAEVDGWIDQVGVPSFVAGLPWQAWGRQPGYVLGSLLHQREIVQLPEKQLEKVVGLGRSCL
jgi:hypothetical protein